jgi:antitoxin CptB
MTAGASDEDPEVRLRRLRMRSWRRGTREMDLLLGGFADARLAGLPSGTLDAYEALLEENDHDLYRWVAGRAAAPPDHAAMIALIRRHHAVG